MGLMKCPVCGEDISDQAETCVHCGAHIEKGEYCRDCGHLLKSTDEFCPKCGRPVKRPKYPQPSKKDNLIRNIVIAAIVVFIAYIGYDFYQYQHESNYYEVVDQIFETRNKSVDTFNESKDLMLNVWFNSIWKTSDAKTNKYTKKNGVFYEDFNDAIDQLYEDKDFQKDLNLLTDTVRELKELKNDLGNPPEEYEEYNEYLIKYVDSYIEASMIIIHPNGSYNDVSDKLSQLIKDGNDYSLKMDVLI